MQENESFSEKKLNNLEEFKNEKKNKTQLKIQVGNIGGFNSYHACRGFADHERICGTKKRL